MKVYWIVFPDGKPLRYQFGTRKAAEEKLADLQKAFILATEHYSIREVEVP